MKKIFLLLAISIVISVFLSSCGDKDGCGDYGKWEARNSKFSK